MKASIIMLIAVIYAGLGEDIEKRKVCRFKKIPKLYLDSLSRMGVDNDSLLNINEGKYLNYIFDIPVEVFDFEGKKIAFQRSSGLDDTKDNFFKDEKERYECGFKKAYQGYLYIFNDSIKNKAKDYDGVIASIPSSINDVVKRINSPLPIKSGTVDNADVSFDSFPKELIKKLNITNINEFETLNEFEGQYLNILFNIPLNKFNFAEKKIFF